MTVSTQNNKDAFDGTGANTALATTFPFINDTELVVTKRVTATGVETELTLNTHYTVTGGDYAIGEVTPVDGATDFPGTVTWTIKRDTPKTQSTNYVENDNFGAETHENALDKLTYLEQDSQEEVDRTLKVAVTDDNPGVLPNSVERASSYMGFDANGDPLALSAPTDTSITTTYIETLLDDIDAATARATLEAQEEVITTKGDLVVGGANIPVTGRLALGAAATYLRSNGTNVAWAALVAADVIAKQQKYPRSYLSGLVVTRTSATEFNVGKGVTRAGSSSDQDLVDIENTNAAFGKLFDNGGWDAGDGGGGVPTAAGFAASAATWHFFQLVKQNGLGYDYGWDTSLSAVNLIADAAVIAALGTACYYRRIRSNVSTATPDFADFTQIGDRTLLTVGELDYSVDGTDFTAGVTITLDRIPLGIDTVGLLRVAWDAMSAGELALILQPTFETSAVPSVSAAPLASFVASGANNADGGEMAIDIDTSQQISARMLTDATIDLDILVRGWIDRRGRDD